MNLDARSLLSSRAWRYALLVFAAGLIVTGIAVQAARQAQIAKTQALFDGLTTRLSEEVTRRVDRVAAGLRGARSAYAASPGHWTLAQFREYVTARDIAADFPGVRGFGYIEQVQRADLDAFISRVRADQAPEFRVKTSGNHEVLYVIKHIEPRENNMPAWGFDVGSESVRREAVERAIANGTASLTGPITLVQDEKRGFGWLIMVPVFYAAADYAAPGGTGRVLRGILYAPIVAAEALASAPRTVDDLVRFRLFDGPSQDGRLIYDTSPSSKDWDSALYRDEEIIVVGGRSMTLQMAGTERLQAQVDWFVPVLVGFAGLLLSVMLALSAWLLLIGRERAERMVRGMSADLQRMAKVLEHTSNAVFGTDAQLRINWINEGFTRMSGYSADDALGRTATELIGHPQADPAALRRLTEAARTGQGARVELLNRHKDGTAYWVETEILPMRDGVGKLTGFIEIALDVTDRRQMEEELRLNNARLQTILENLPCGLSVFDSQLHLVAHNTRFRTLLGFPDTLFAGKIVTFEEIIRFNAARGEYGSGDVESQVQLIIERARNPQQHHLERRRPNGTHLEIRGAPMPGGGFVTTYIDVTDRMRAEEALRASEDLMRVVTDNLPGQVAYWDRHLRCKFVNRVFCDAVGRPRDALLGHSLPEIYGHALHEELATHIEAALQGEPRTFERQVAGPAGQTRTLQVHHIPDGTGQDVHGFFVLATDVTEIREARDLALQASVAKGQFLANMSHEIRTPMNAILGMLTLLKTTSLDARQLEYAEKAEGASRSLLGLLNDILDFSKVEAGKMALDPRPFSMDAMLRDLSVILSATVGDKPVEVLFDLDPQVPAWLLGDDMRLRQIFINLGGNAIKFTERGEVVLRIRQLSRDAQGVHLEIGVKDTGIGIAPELVEHIFTGFSQAEASTSRRFGGTGLGLAICQRLVSLMGGTLAVDSTPGRGSDFHFSITLPTATAPEPQPITSSPALRLPVERVLIVDDNDIAREAMAVMAGSLGWKVDTAADGEGALAQLADAAREHKHYDALFIDWRMPGMDGWQTSQQLREMAGIGDAPVVVMVTAHGKAALEKRSTADQGLLDGFLVKPVTPSMLVDAVAQALGHSSRQTAPTPQQGAARPLQGLRILVVEDNANNQQIARELLSRQGASVDIAVNGRDGVDQVVSATPPHDLVLMDVQMPVMDGYAATRLLRDTHGLVNLPIVAMTANALASDHADCLAAGMNDHVGKPFDLAHLVQTILQQTGRLTVRDTQEPTAVPSDDEVLELDAALERLGGDIDLYQKILPSFESDASGLIARLQQMAVTGNLTGASPLIHTLKGLAGTVGARRLAELSRDLESRLARGDDVALCPAFAQLRIALDQAMAQIRLAMPTPADAAPSGAQDVESTRMTPQNLHDLRLLSDLLKGSDMAAVGMVATLAPQLGRQAGQPGERLDRAMATLDFHQAAALCDELLALHDNR